MLRHLRRHDRHRAYVRNPGAQRQVLGTDSSRRPPPRSGPGRDAEILRTIERIAAALPATLNHLWRLQAGAKC